MENRSRRTRLRHQSLAALLGFILIFGPVGCGISPKERQHWWQFWRSKPAAGVYRPDNIILPPAADGIPGQSSSLDVPPPPVVTPGMVSEPERIRAAAEGTVEELRTVYFDFDSADLTGQAQATLEANAAWMLAHPSLQYQLEGHTDERGTVEYNLNLGDRRAKAVKEFLIMRGVPANNLHTISYGEERPVDISGTEAAYAQNRRVQFFVY